MTIQYRFNERKALQALCWLAQQRPGITLHTVAKVLFYADKKHLNAYGRPIIGDEYAAMPYGPVPSNTYNILKGDGMMLEALGLDEPPLEIRHGKCVFSKRDSGMEALSPSDLECLEESLRENGSLSFGQLVDKTHADKAWAEAPGHWMRYEDFLDDGDDAEEKIVDLELHSRRMVV